MIKGRYYVMKIIPKLWASFPIHDTYLPERKIIKNIYEGTLIYITDIINSQWCSIRFVDYGSPMNYDGFMDDDGFVDDRYLIEEGYGDFEPSDTKSKVNKKRYPLMDGYIRYRIENNYKLYPSHKTEGDGTIIDNPYFIWVSSQYILRLSGDVTRYLENEGCAYGNRIIMLNEKIQKIQKNNTLWHQNIISKNNQIAQLQIKNEQSKETIDQLKNESISQNNIIDQQSNEIKQQEEMINQLLIALDEKNKTVTQSIIGLFK